LQEQLQVASLGKVELTALRSTEARIRDLSTRLELELAIKTRLESTLDRLRDQLRESEQVRILILCFLLSTSLSITLHCIFQYPSHQPSAI